MRKQGKCKKCGGDYEIHHFKTDQCPVGGREAPPDRLQIWKSTTFEVENETGTLRTEIAELRECLESMLYTLECWKTFSPESWDMGDEQSTIRTRTVLDKYPKE
jgi:hypothetical protein